MFASTRGNTRLFGVASLLVAAALTACVATTAFAEEVPAPNDQVQKAYSELTQLSEKAEQSAYDVISIRAQLDETQRSIDDLTVRIGEGEKELNRTRHELSQFMRGDYKQGQQSLVDIMLSSSDFEQFLSRVTYANKVVEHERTAIAHVDSLMSQLTQQKYDLEKSKASLENMLQEQTVRVEAATVATSDVQSFIEQMPEEMLQQVMAYEQSVREQNTERSKEILQQIEQMAEESNLTGNSSSAAEEGSVAQPVIAASDVTAGGSDAGSTVTASQGESSIDVPSSSASASSSSDSDFMTRLYSLVGSGYQWSGYNWTGSTSDSSFTCSGVVDYALGRDSQSSSPETLYDEVGSNITTDVSSLKEGDLVFYSYGGRDVGHVAVYVGNGQVIDSIPNGGVAVRDVDYMDVVGGGSLSY